MEEEELAIRVLICGDRKNISPMFLDATLESLHKKRRLSVIIEDTYSSDRKHDARDWAGRRGVPHVVCPIDQATRGRVRRRPLDVLRGSNPDVLVAFGTGPQTAQIVKIARASGVGVIEISTASDGLMAWTL